MCRIEIYTTPSSCYQSTESSQSDQMGIYTNNGLHRNHFIVGLVPVTYQTVLKNANQHVTKFSYGATLSVKSSNLRKVTIELTFNSQTVERLRQEMSGNTGESALLKFILTANNINTRDKRTMLYKGAVSPVHCMPFTFPLKLGNKYKFEVEVQRILPQRGQFGTVLKTSVKHREVLTHAELFELLQRATLYNQRRSTENLEVQFAYRNKPPPYFQRIKQERRNIMEVYSKDRNGDPGCPINEQINGLFFGLRIDPNTRTLPDESYFGSRRIIIPIGKLVEEPIRLYFADFYCHKNVHHITLVTTKPESLTDHFCMKYLLELSLENNPFFFRVSNSTDSKANQKFYCSREPRVEILYTENINLNAEYIVWKTVKILGMGSSTRNGIPKRPDCDICNLYPVHQLLNVADSTF